MDNREELAPAVPIEDASADAPAPEATPQEIPPGATLPHPGTLAPKGFVVVAKYLFASQAAANGFARRLFSTKSPAMIDRRVEVHPFHG